MTPSYSRSTAATVLFALSAIPIHASQALSAAEVLAALRQGGLVIVMRHAASPRQPPTRAEANPDNAALERQLDEKGRADAKALGLAWRELKIPIGKVLSSPTYRALETAHLAQLATPQTDDRLGDGGQSMQAATDAQGTWLRTQTAAAVSGTNVVLITHQPNLARAFPTVAGVADGESLIFRPDGKGGATLIGRVKIDEWSRLR